MMGVRFPLRAFSFSRGPRNFLRNVTRVGKWQYLIISLFILPPMGAEEENTLKQITTLFKEYQSRVIDQGKYVAQMKALIPDFVNSHLEPGQCTWVMDKGSKSS